MLEIGTKQGITYYCECKHLSSIASPPIGNNVNMLYTGFFDEVWNEYDYDFDAIGYGLKKTRTNKGVIICDNAAQCFDPSRGYVGMVLSFPHNIIQGVYEPLKYDTSLLNSYLLWGINVGCTEPSFPTINAKLTPQGIKFTIWSNYGQYTIVDNVSNIYANTPSLYEFIWSSDRMDDFSLNDFDATMTIRIQGEDVAIGNYPIGVLSLTGYNVCFLDSPLNYYNMECTISRLILGNEIPESITKEWHSSSTSSSSSANDELFYDKLAYADILNEPSIKSVHYASVDAISDYLMFTDSVRRFNNLWLVNSGTGNTVSKIDIRDVTNPSEIGRYRLASSGDDPSRTLVTSLGDCWIASRKYGTVTKIGLIESSHCRNTCLNTSTGINELTYGSDDAVLYYFDVSSEKIKTTSSIPSNNGIKVLGLTDDANDNIWIEAGENSGKSGTWYKILGDSSIVKYSSLLTNGSHGAICSYKNDYIWSVRNDFTGIDFFKATDPINYQGNFNYVQPYEIAYSKGYVYAGDYASSPSSTMRRVIRINEDVVNNPDGFPTYATTFLFTNCLNTKYFPRSFAVIVNEDSTEDLYINWCGIGTNSYLGIIRNHAQYDDGELITIDFSSCEKYILKDSYVSNISVSYDQNAKPFVWIVNSNNTNAQAFNPITNQMQLFGGVNYTPLGKTSHFAYNNFTGTVDEDEVFPINGMANYVIDSEYTNTRWDNICMTTTTPANSNLTIYVSASEDYTIFPVSRSISNCADIRSLNIRGRYLRLILDFSRVTQYSSSPTVRDINIGFTKD